nr:MAG TPA: hypothetical protein [Caudoviricetes sp.]
MSFRYELKTKKDGETIDYIQLFGNNDYIEPVHNFIRERFFADEESEIDEDGCFEVVLSKDGLNDLYRVVDKYCIDLVKGDEKTYRYIDLLKNYHGDSDDFGQSNWAIVQGNYYSLESAALNNFLAKNKAIRGFMCPFEIKEGYEVAFRYG